ncbi:hypothetical protein CVT25_002932 [Psilocybe cyanescens]|uniref:Uncharacterized protein n=1 Tax=Psilocybe cyanescens TaxID=93625 RepID=A0A409WMZ9_PSICY|nr:hypothetical protein CVT25_002932 [Psilocybe cyanescens]
MSAPNPSPDSNGATHQSHPLPKQKLAALARLKSFSGSFIQHRKTPPPVFPPPSWELSDELLGDYKSSTTLLESNFEDPPAVEVVSFAQRLRGLIESLPLPTALSSSVSSAQSGSHTAEAQPIDGKSGSPVPPGMDEGLVRMLSSEDVMNGNKGTASTGSDNNSRPGVWNILASLRNSSGKEGSTDPRRGAVEEQEDGVMMYAPLEPKSDSQLELASSETILEYVDEPGSRKSHKRNEVSEGQGHSGESTSKPSEGSKAATIEKHVWVPSTTQLSLLTTWWGYRLYLPPPIMAKLDNTSLKATARAAMITTALKWLLDKIPIMLVPPQFRPAVKMLKQLSPVVGYIGVFIAWSWDRVRACDKGNGVVLTATWLLPVALVPMSWDAGDIYGPSPPPKPEDMTTAAEDPPATTSESAEKEKSKDKKKTSLFRW